MDALPFHSEGFAARSQYMRSPRATKNTLRHRSGRFDNVLAAVQNEENLLVFEKRHQHVGRIFRTNRDAERGGEGARNKRGIAERRQIDEIDAILKSGEREIGDSQRDRRLSNSARSRYRDKSMFQQVGGDADRDLGPADHSCQRRRKSCGLSPVSGGGTAIWCSSEIAIGATKQ